MRCEFKSATQIYVSPIYFELQLILRNDPFLHTRTWWQNRWNRKNCPKLFHRVIFAFWIQFCNPNLCNSHIFWITANIGMWSFFAYPDLMTKIGEIGKIARNSFIGKFLRSEFKSATQIYVNSIYFELQLILGCDLFLHMTKIGEIGKIARNSFIGKFLRSEFKSATQIYVNSIYFEVLLIFRNDQNWWNRKKCPKFFHRVFFAFWIQICNQNLCKYPTFWNTANIEKLTFFAFQDLMTKIDGIGKIAWNSFIG